MAMSVQPPASRPAQMGDFKGEQLDDFMTTLVQLANPQQQRDEQQKEWRKALGID